MMRHLQPIYQYTKSHDAGVEFYDKNVLKGKWVKYQMLN